MSPRNTGTILLRKLKLLYKSVKLSVHLKHTKCGSMQWRERVKLTTHSHQPVLYAPGYTLDMLRRLSMWLYSYFKTFTSQLQEQLYGCSARRSLVYF